MNRRMAVLLLLLTFPASASASAQSSSRPGGGHGGGGYPRGIGRAVPRHPGGGRPMGGPVHGAAIRHPRAGYGHGYYGHGGYYGHRYYGGYYGHYPYYGYSPYWGYAPYWGGYYYPYGWGLGLGLSFYYGEHDHGSPYVVYATGESYAPGVSYARNGGAPPEEYAPRGEARIEAETGDLRLYVTPTDAVVYVDDEFRGTARRLQRMRLPPGRHRIEIVRPGFAVAEREVDVAVGAVATLEVDLERP